MMGVGAAVHDAGAGAVEAVAATVEAEVEGAEAGHSSR